MVKQFGKKLNNSSIEIGEILMDNTKSKEEKDFY